MRASSVAGGCAVGPIEGRMATIRGDLVPASGLAPAGGPDVESYDGRYDPQEPGSVIDFHVPV